jgi:hypothetical protein
MNNVIPFARPAKPKRYTGPIQAERERCIAIFTAPEARGVWESAARILATETDMSAEQIVAALRSARAEVKAEIAADIAAGRLGAIIGNAS